MKLTNLVLSLVLVLSSLTGHALENLSAKEELIKAQANLSDLETQLAYQQHMKTSGWVGVAVSTTAIGGGILLSFVDGFGDLGVNILKSAFNDHTITKTSFLAANRANILLFGGATGVVGSGVIIYIKHEKINEVNAKIEAEKAEINSILQKMN